MFLQRNTLKTFHSHTFKRFSHWCYIYFKLINKSVSQKKKSLKNTTTLNYWKILTMIKIICTGTCFCFRECVCSLLIRHAGGTTVSCVLELVVQDLLHLLSCYYSVKSCCVFPRKGSYFISTFCLCLNVSDALSAIFTCFNSALHPN